MNKRKGYVSLIGMLITIIIMVIILYLINGQGKSKSPSNNGGSINNTLENVRNTVNDINKRTSSNSY